MEHMLKKSNKFLVQSRRTLEVKDGLIIVESDALPEGEKFPPSFYESKKLVKGLGLNYKKIHACPNDCMLFRKEFANKDINNYLICGASRWKNSIKKIPAKVLRHFPLKPRLQRLFVSSKTSKLMRWHYEERNRDGVPRHPAYTEAWKAFETRHLEFAKDSCNVLLGLASDGFNSFGMMRSHMVLYQDGALMVNLHVLAANISTQSKRLKHGKKFYFMGHRRFLKQGHKYRNNAKSLDGTKELRTTPSPISGSQVLKQVRGIKFTLGQLREKASGVMKNTWKKKIIFFNLPYWEYNLVHHNLDMMHIEKNVCDNLIYTLLGLGKKTKDNLEARLDLKEMNIKPSLWPKKRASGRTYLCYT
ncbi:uncharacterized protein LOC132615335 [Lycium barbarum]|uniref:uncharacterized protein LOC132615335 n=1 Tax=Lycium barbarum TaxID=112863 RepID=UPI00293E043B|nr:uncharacterized protein LOC132615335 [Lycium barbarum]